MYPARCRARGNGRPRCPVLRTFRRTRAGAAEDGGIGMDVLGTLQNFFGPTWPAVWTLTKIVAIVVPLMLCVAYLTLAERKVIGWMQVRLGPNRVTFFGIRWLGGWAQPIADGLKLLVKEIIVPSGANKFLFVLAPIMAITPALAAWAVVPYGPERVLADIDAGLLYVMAITSMG